MKNSLLSLANSEGVSLYSLTDKLHTSRKSIIHAVYELQDRGHHIYIENGQVYYFKNDNKLVLIGLLGAVTVFFTWLMLAVTG